MIESRDGNDWEHQLIKFIPKESADTAETETKESTSAEHGNQEDRSKTCHNHPDIEAAFKCSDCGRLLCEECVEEKSLSGEWFRFCSECGSICNSFEELEEVPEIPDDDEASEGRRKSKKPLGRILAPEPPPVDRQLISILILPFRGMGVTVVLAWSVWLFMTGLYGLILLIPYLGQLYARIEEGNKELPGPWRLGGGFGHVVRALGTTVISPILPLIVCYVLVSPGSSGIVFPIIGDRAIALIRSAQPWSLGVVAVILLSVPLMMVVHLRTGNPFISLDLLVMLGLIRRSYQRYMSLLISTLMIVVVSYGLYRLMSLVPFGRTSFNWVALITPPTIAAAMAPVQCFLCLTMSIAAATAAILCSFWFGIAMAVFGRWLGWSLGEESELNYED